MHMRAAGDRAVLVELGDVSAGRLHAMAARTRQVPGVVACIIGHSSLYVIFEDAKREADLQAALDAVPMDATLRGRHHEIAVNFAEEYGPDLPLLLERTGVRREHFLDRIRSVRLTARFLGFRGGFAYLEGWPDAWSLPRRETSRLDVSRGSFAIAGDLAGFYPVDSPGGWNILGRAVPESIAPGDDVTIVPTAERIVSEPAPAKRLSLPWADVIAPGQSTLLVGPPDQIPFDDMAAAIANRSVGNESDSELLECTLVGPHLRFRQRAIVSWCDATTSQQFVVEEGDELQLGRVRNGMRGYLAVGETNAPMMITRDDRHVIQAMAGPHDVGLRDVECVVTPQLNRVGIRLQPVMPLGITPPADLRSIGMQCGTVQLHPDGTLVAMGPDHPITGGYLQPFTVVSTDRWKLAQIAPGEHVRFVIR